MARQVAASRILASLAVLLACAGCALADGALFPAKPVAGLCPDICGRLPEKQRSAAGLAVSMVVLTSCAGDIEGAARAVATAAADGDLTAFGAGLSVGAAVIAGPDDSGRGQMAQIISETLSTADSKNKTVGVASALGNALGSMAGSGAEAMANQTVQALNDLVTGASCSLPTTSAASLFFSTKAVNPGLAAFFLKSALAFGDKCWVRRLSKLKASPVFNLPPPTSPCTRRMQAASAVSLSLVTASACRAEKAAPVAAAAYALVTAATNDGCSFASAVAASQMSGLPREAVKEVFTAAITKAGESSSQQQLSSAFVEAFAQLDSDNGNKLLDSLLGAMDATVAVSGCSSAHEFAAGLFRRLVALDPSSRSDVARAFAARPRLAGCSFDLQV